MLARSQSSRRVASLAINSSSGSLSRTPAIDEAISSVTCKRSIRRALRSRAVDTPKQQQSARPTANAPGSSLWVKLRPCNTKTESAIVCDCNGTTRNVPPASAVSKAAASRSRASAIIGKGNSVAGERPHSPTVSHTGVRRIRPTHCAENSAATDGSCSVRKSGTEWASGTACSSASQRVRIPPPACEGFTQGTSFHESQATVTLYLPFGERVVWITQLNQIDDQSASVKPATVIKTIPSLRRICTYSAGSRPENCLARQAHDCDGRTSRYAICMISSEKNALGRTPSSSCKIPQSMSLSMSSLAVG